MSTRVLCTILGLALVAAGCQQSTSTGPGGTRRSGEGTAASGAKKLTVTVAQDQTVRRGAEDKVMININRDNFNDAVNIKFSNLPKGVELVDKDIVIASGSNSATVTLKAAADAELGEHQVTITADAPGLGDNTQTFKLNVKEK